MKGHLCSTLRVTGQTCVESSISLTHGAKQQRSIHQLQVRERDQDGVRGFEKKKLGGIVSTATYTSLNGIIFMVGISCYIHVYVIGMGSDL